MRRSERITPRDPRGRGSAGLLPSRLGGNLSEGACLVAVRAPDVPRF